MTKALTRQYMYSYPHKSAYRSCQRLQIGPYLSDWNKQPLSLYFHIPFCESKCGYCNLFSVARPQADVVEAYLKAIKRQSAQFQSELPKIEQRPVSWVFGGGTPLWLSVAQLETLFQLAVRDYGVKPGETLGVVETSPRQSSAEKLDCLRHWQLQRISLGVQSFVPAELAVLERNHSAKESLQALERIRQADFPVLNVDLIYGIPGQTLNSLQYSLKQALAFQPEELFFYPLYNQPNARLYGRVQLELSMQEKLYWAGREELLCQGYQQVSMRRFVRSLPRQESDCGFENVVSLGCGGRSYLGTVHFCESYRGNLRSCSRILQQYLKKQDFFSHITMYLLNTDEQKRRYIIKNLLHTGGLSLTQYSQYFSTEAEMDFPLLTQLVERGQAVRQGHNISLTADGLACSDQIGPQFISSTVRKRMRNYGRI